MNDQRGKRMVNTAGEHCHLDSLVCQSSSKALKQQFRQHLPARWIDVRQVANYNNELSSLQRAPFYDLNLARRN
jgi:hypothetical protein